MCSDFKDIFIFYAKRNYITVLEIKKFKTFSQGGLFDLFLVVQCVCMRAMEKQLGYGKFFSIPPSFFLFSLSKYESVLSFFYIQFRPHSFYCCLFYFLFFILFLLIFLLHFPLSSFFLI